MAIIILTIKLTKMSLRQIKSYKEYLLEDANMENDWGWFVDIELPIVSENITNKTTKKKNLATIYEDFEQITSVDSPGKEDYSLWSLQKSCVISVIMLVIILL